MKNSKTVLKNIISSFFILLFAAVIVYWAFGTSGSIVSGKSYPMSDEEFENNKGLALDADDSEIISPQITAENLADFMRTYELPQDILWTMTYVDVATENRFACSYRLKGNKERVECYKNGSLYYYYIFSPEYVVSYDAQTNVRTYLEWQEYDTMSFIFMMPYNELRSMTPDRVISISFETLLNQRMIFVEYKGETEGFTKKCWISLEYGVPIVCETYKDGVRIDHVTTGSFAIDVADPIIFE